MQLENPWKWRMSPRVRFAQDLLKVMEQLVLKISGACTKILSNFKFITLKGDSIKLMRKDKSTYQLTY